MESARSVFDYLATCSEPAVESFELSRLNRAAILRKQMRQLIDEWVACEAEAQLARWTRQSRRVEMAVDAASLPGANAALPEQLALPLLPPSTRVPLKGSHEPSGGQLARASSRGATNRATRTQTSPSPNNPRAAERPPYKNEVNSHSARFAPLLASESKSMNREGQLARTKLSRLAPRRRTAREELRIGTGGAALRSVTVARTMNSAATVVRL